MADKYTKSCKVCGVEFLVCKSKLDKVYCSQACCRKDRWGDPSALLRECDFCKSPFRKFRQKRFCSRECFDAYRTNKKQCNECYTPETSGRRCNKHNAERQRLSAAKSTKKAKKAKSMQGCYRQATNKNGTLRLQEAREIIENTPICPYCKEQIDWPSLSLDHIIPISRGGSCEPDNLVWAHLSCNLMKGTMTGDEFMLLLAFMSQHEFIRQNVSTRLKAAGAIFGRK